MIRSWPRAIAHVDADAFFASVEQAMNPKLRGRPVITGAERGIVAAASYEAKAMGVKRGVPDICLPVPLGGYAGLYIELKAGKNRPTPEQREWLSALTQFGYFAVVCYGFEEAVATITKYIKQEAHNG